LSRIAITISGAVSLGTFEAGALWEILDAFAQHNTNAAANNLGRVEVDVLTGASAGGMSCAIAANKLSFDAAALADPIDNVLYQSWVIDANIYKMLPSDDPLHSLLSSKHIQDIAHDCLLARYLADGSPAKTAKRHTAAAANLSLGLAMSNLTGVDYKLDFRLNNSFVYSEFKDQFTRSEIVDANDVKEFWDPVALAAVACGAFPFAFPVQDITRNAADYPSNATFPPTGGHFAFTDGGVFQNEPLGMAINLAQAKDLANNAAADRYYVYIAPGAKTSVLGKKPFYASSAALLPLGIRLVECIFNQARFQDWIQMQETNNQVIGFHRALSSVAPNTLLQLAANAKPAPYALNAANAQLTADANATPAAINVLQSASDLGLVKDTGVFKEYIYAYGISAGESELQGAEMLAFKGFLRQSFREHDYAVGRLKARQWLRKLAPGNSPLEPLVIFNTRPPNDDDLLQVINASPPLLDASEGDILLRRFSPIFSGLEKMFEPEFEKLFAGQMTAKLLQYLILKAEGNA
jgi:predicted acylesterase/phospholipase RssA